MAKIKFPRRFNALCRKAKELHKQGETGTKIITRLLVWNDTHCDPPLKDYAILSAIRQIGEEK